MTAMTIDEVLAAYPTLDKGGFADQHETLSPNFCASREALRGSPRLQAAAAWIRENLSTTKRVNTHRTSYAFKRAVEKAQGYVTNGEFIAAAAMAGLQVRPIPGTPNAEVNISERSWQEVATKLGLHG